MTLMGEIMHATEGELSAQNDNESLCTYVRSYSKKKDRLIQLEFGEQKGKSVPNRSALNKQQLGSRD